MKRSAVIAVTAMVAGLLLAITAVAAPFRDYGRAAGDQYTTPTTTTVVTTTTTTGGGGGATVTVAGQATVGGESGGPTTVPTTETTPDEDGGPTTTDSTPDDGNDDDGAAAPAGDGGAVGPGGGSGALPRTGDGRGTIAFMSVTDPPEGLGSAVLNVIGIPAWLGTLKSSLPGRAGGTRKGDSLRGDRRRRP